MSFKITFPGNKKVNAEFNEFVVNTDQPFTGGGDGSAPTPFEVFLASLGTCAGIYVLGFCNSRGLPTEGIELIQDVVWDPIRQKVGTIKIDINVPPHFPEKYHSALVRSAEMCAVKRLIEDPPQFIVTTSVTETATVKN